MATNYDDPRNLDRMFAIEKQLDEVLERINRETPTEAVFAAFALVRRARVLLDKYPKNTRDPFVQACVLYLQRAEVKIEDETTRRIITLH